MSPSTDPSWRGSANKTVAGGSRSWRRPGNGITTGWNPRSKWMKTLMGGCSSLALLASSVLYFYLWSLPGCNHTEFTYIAPAPYSNYAMPPQPFAKDDADAFRDQFKAKKISSLAGLDLKQKTNVGSPNKSSHKTQIVFVTALAGQLESGVILYREEAGPDNINETNDYIPVQQLWDFLATMPAEQSKLLIIDIATGPIDWRWGQFTRPQIGSVTEKGDVTGLVTDALSRIPNLAILTSAAPGERSWASPILRHSVFAHFFIQGIAGKADEKNNEQKSGGNDDSRVTLDELYNFVLARTNHWVEQNRDPRGQNPQLLIAQGQRERMMKMVIAEVRDKISFPSSSKASTLDGPLLKRIEDLWAERDAWKEKEAEQWHPLAWRKLLENLRRAEQWWMAGQPEWMDRHLDSAKDAANSLKEQYESRKRYFESGRREPGEVLLSKSNFVKPEEHLLRMFEAFTLPAFSTSQYVRDSCAQRRFAEEQSWQSFRSRMWTGNILNEADQERRFAEDLLFIGGEEELKRSADKREEANKNFGRHRQIVQLFSEMEHLHNRLLAELPDLALWAANRIPHEMISSPPDESRRMQMMGKFSNLLDQSMGRSKSLRDYEFELSDFLNSNGENECQAFEAELLVLFERTRELGQLLDREREHLVQSFDTDKKWLDERKAVYDGGTQLVALIKRLESSTADLTKDVSAALDSTGAGQQQYYHWLKCRNALQWSGLPKAQRFKLFRELTESDRMLFDHSEKNTVDQLSKRGSDWTNVDGCWQAMWALQTLSLGSSKSVMDPLWGDWNKARVASGTELLKIGSSVRREFSSREKEAKDTPNETDQLPDAMNTFLKAQRAARTMHGHDAILFNFDHDPIPKLYKFDLAALCLLQADRYLEDFWGNLLGDNPWYVEAVDQCLKASRQHADQLGVRAITIARKGVEERLGERKNASLRVAEVAKKTVDLTTTDKSEPTTVEVAIDERTPPGFAALELNEVGVDPGSNILTIAPTGRQAIEHQWQKKDSVKRTFTIQKKEDKSVFGSNCVEIQIQPQLLFRGRYWNSDDQPRIHVDPCEPKPVIHKYEALANKKGRIVVKGIDRRDTIFMLDCSLSMTNKIGTEKAAKPGESSRFGVATKAIAEILNELLDENAHQRDKYVVGLAAFGHRLKAGPPTPETMKEAIKKGQSAPRNPADTEINEVWQSEIWDFKGEKNLGANPRNTTNWKRDCELLQPPRPLDDTQFRRMKASLDSTLKVPNAKGGFIQPLGPFGDTPLLNSIYSVSEYLVDKRKGGLLIVVCDGAFNDEPTSAPLYKTVIDYCTKFQDQLSLHLVAFDVNSGAEISVLDELSKVSGGQFHKAATRDDLAKIARKALTPRKFKVVRETGRQLEFKEDLGNEVDELEPSEGYKVRFEGVPDFPATISGGELLELDLDNTNKQIVHRRPDLKVDRDIVRGQRFVEPDGPTKLGYLKAEFNKTDPANKSGVATFWFGLNRGDSSGMVVRPKEIRIDITRKGSEKQQFSGLWKMVEAKSIPVWEISLEDWPDDPKAYAEINAFWKMTYTAPDKELPLVQLITSRKEEEIAWPAGPLMVTADRDGGKVRVKLESNIDPPGSSVADIRVELGELSPVEQLFVPSDFNWTSKFLRKKGGGGKITYVFDVLGEDMSNFRIAITSLASLQRDASVLQSKLPIENWDFNLK